MRKSRCPPILSFDSWNEQSSYFFGLLMADGTFRKRKNSYEIRLRMKDKQIIENYCEFLNFPYERIKTETVLYKNERKIIYGINSGNTYLCQKLEELGMPLGIKYPVTQFPKTMPTNLINHFIRGYFDGDGSVGIYKRNDRPSTTKRINFSGYNIDFLIKIKSFLPVNKGKIISATGTNQLLYSLSKSDFIEVRNYLYKDATVFLDRKKEIFFSV